jgi:hypothetical protein
MITWDKDTVLYIDLFLKETEKRLLIINYLVQRFVEPSQLYNIYQTNTRFNQKYIKEC